MGCGPGGGKVEGRVRGERGGGGGGGAGGRSRRKVPDSGKIECIIECVCTCKTCKEGKTQTWQ